MTMRPIAITLNVLIALLVLLASWPLFSRSSYAAGTGNAFVAPDLLLCSVRPSPDYTRLRLLDKTIISTYVVQPHDTLWSIAKMFNTDADTLRSSNGLDVIALPPGRVLRIPNHRGMLYDTKAGENFEAVRKNFVWGKREPTTFTRTILAINDYPIPDLKNENHVFSTNTPLFLPNTFVDYHQLAIPLMGGYRKTSGFGMRLHPLLGIRRMHDGWDLAKPYGSPVFAAREGRVIFTGWSNGYGNLIIVKHSIKRKNGYNDITTMYGHLSKILVESGQKVHKGQKIGLVGSTGISTGPHLHFEIRDASGRPRNPWNYLQ